MLPVLDLRVCLYVISVATACITYPGQICNARVMPVLGERFLAATAGLRSPMVWDCRVIDFVPPQSGVYYVHVASDTLGIGFNNPQYIILHVTDPQRH